MLVLILQILNLIMYVLCDKYILKHMASNCGGFNFTEKSLNMNIAKIEITSHISLFTVYRYF